jgi:peptidoglycan/LPS O-acetylase OafA/YrhL
MMSPAIMPTHATGARGPSAPRGAGIPHLPALDGLRGLALAGVLLFHAGGALPGGYLGVDLFFVLSGFLITSLLIGEHGATGRIALGPFWARRARRLLPALLSLMLAVAVYARFFARPAELADLRGSALATFGYVANWRAILSHASYWNLFAAPSPPEHTWSLSIEEQFYVVWPLAVALILRRGSRRAVLVVSIGLSLLSMGAMAVLFDPADTSRAYLGTDTRAAAILAGAALAAAIPPDRSFLGTRAVRWLDGLGLVSVAGLAVAWCRLAGDRRFLYRGGFWLTEAAALVLILCAVAGSRSVVARALSWKPLTWLGTVSYGVYLWHWPVDVLVTAPRAHLHGAWLHVLRIAISLAIAVVSYRALERPIRMSGGPLGRQAYAMAAVVAAAVLLVVRGTHAREEARRGPPGDGATASAGPLDPAAGTPRFRVMVLGDSTANSLGWALRGARKPGLDVELEGRDGCSMLIDSCRGAEWAARAAALHPDATLVVLGGAFLHGLDVDNGWRVACHPGWNHRFEDNLARRLGELAGARGRTWAVTVPYPLGRYDDASYRSQVDCINASIRKAAASVAGVEVLDLGERLCPNGACERDHDGEEIRPDGVHYTIEGAAGLSAWVLQQVGS